MSKAAATSRSQKKKVQMRNLRIPAQVSCLCVPDVTVARDDLRPRMGTVSAVKAATVGMW